MSIIKKTMRNYLVYKFLLCFSINFGQTAVIDVKRVATSLKEDSNYVKFIFNDQSFGEKDTIVTIKINKKGFDICSAIINNDTLKFITKFKKNEKYTINQGCCCAIFTLEAQNKPKRGTVKFKNKTKKNLGLVVAEANIEKVNSGTTQNIYASESAMCLFKPCSILLTETEYLSKKYDYQFNKNPDENLWEEQKKYKIAFIWFHFLHGEKIEVLYKEKTNKLDINLLGYLTEKEFKEVLDNLNKSVQD